MGPRSAGATPGPAAYGTGGTEPTLTDANVVLGRIDPDRFLGGEMRSTARPPRRPWARLAESLGMSLLEAAEGIVTIANANMAGAIRSRTIQKGHDPREFTLVAFGGGGPLAAAEVADLLGAPEVLVPPFPGITAATGLLTSDLKYDQMRTVFMIQGAIDADRIDRELEEHRGRVARAPARRRRRGRGHPGHHGARLPLPRPGLRAAGRAPGGRFSEAALEEFHRMHRQEYGHAFTDPIEVVNLRVTATGVRPKVERLPPADGAMDDALIGEGEGVFRVDGVLASLPATTSARACRRASPSRAPRSSSSATPRCWSPRAGAVVPSPPATSYSPDEHRPHPRRSSPGIGHRRRARLDRHRDGPQARPHELLVDHPRERGLRLRHLRRRRAPALRVARVHPCSRAPSPATSAGSTAASPRSARSGGPATS